MLIKQRNRLFEMKAPKSLRIAYVWGKGLGLFADKNFRKGNVVIAFKADVVDRAHASAEAVQVDENKFYDTKWLVPEAFINHSYSPNMRLDVAKKRYVAIRNIEKNEEITFNYNTTEWDMKKYGDDFECHCGCRNCVGRVKGLKYLTRAEQQRLKPFLLPFLLKKISA